MSSKNQFLILNKLRYKYHSYLLKHDYVNYGPLFEGSFLKAFLTRNTEKIVKKNF